ncbi:hypothetical protein ACIBVL_25810 [Streptomyces sp. NPDC049687]|uniref:hypothetical protein n=1 Tax=Streptomyces sp. NPDC049687 TaxID=3365596 RepID=UPI0037981D9D
MTTRNWSLGRSITTWALVPRARWAAAYYLRLARCRGASGGGPFQYGAGLRGSGGHQAYAALRQTEGLADVLGAVAVVKHGDGGGGEGVGGHLSSSRRGVGGGEVGEQGHEVVLAAGQTERAQQVGEVVLVSGVVGDHQGGGAVLVAAERGEFEVLGCEGLFHVGEHDRPSYAALVRGLRWALSSSSRVRFC